MLQRNTSSAASSRLGSDGRSLGRGSDSGAGSDKGSQLNPSDRIASMYDSLAAELREKLSGTNKEPLLLPPRDYDTMHRSRGNMVAGVGGTAQAATTGADIASGKTASSGGVRGAIVGGGGDSSGNSSGIGSQSPSPVHEAVFDALDRSSTGEKWIEPQIIQTYWSHQLFKHRLNVQDEY